MGQGLSYTKIQVALRAEGMGIRRQAITDIGVEFRGATNRMPGLRFIGNPYRPGERSITQTQYAFNSEFRVFGEVRTLNPMTGERALIPVNFGYSDPLTVGQIKSHLEELAEPIMGSLETETDSVVLNQIQRRIQ